MKKELRKKKRIYVNKNTYLIKVSKGDWRVSHKGKCDAQMYEDEDGYIWEGDCSGIEKLDYLRKIGAIK